MGGQLWSEKGALKVGSGVSHGNSHEEAANAVLDEAPNPKPRGMK